MIIEDILLLIALNIERHRGGSDECQQSVFSSRKKTPVNPTFTAVDFHFKIGGRGG